MSMTVKDLRDAIQLFMNPEPTKQLTFVFPKSLVEAYGIENAKEMLVNRYGGSYDVQLNFDSYLFRRQHSILEV